MMTASHAQIRSHSTLAARLAAEGPLQLSQAVELTVKIAGQVAALHRSGCIHGAISVDAILLDETGLPKVPEITSTASILLDSGAQWLPFFPELTRFNSSGLPREIDLAQRQLQVSGITLDPRQVDYWQLGELLCQMLTGESSQAYVRSPRVKGKVSPELRPILERALGANGQSRFADMEELLDALPGAAGSAPVAANTPATSDTTPSFIASARSSADTTVVTPDRPVPAFGSDQDPQSSPPFQRLGHYEIVRLIGRGGMGDVYEGYEPALDRKVAIKVLPTDLERNEEFVRRFKAEATAAAKLIHPNIIQIYFIGEDAGRHFFAMQYVEGESLADLQRRRGKLTVDEALPIVEQSLAGLAAAHEQGMVHRDIKPGNILLDARLRRALLADFGLVKSLEASVAGGTATGVVMGTVDYISPEQGRGQAVDGRSDLYSLGVLLYHLLSGRLPFNADNPTALIFQHVYETPPALSQIAPEIPSALTAIIERLLAKSPADRHQTAADLLADLRAFRSEQPIPSQLAGTGGRRQSTIIRLPAFDDNEPLLPAGLASIPAQGFWNQVGDRAQSIFRRHAPERLKQLQNTQQQVEGAVAEYERRQRSLRQLVHEANSVLQELQQQVLAQRDAVATAERRVQTTADRTEQARACDEQANCRRAAEELERQVVEQNEQLEPMRLRLAQVEVRVQQLRNQRDIFNARLKAAAARVHVEAGYSSRRWRWGSVALLTGIAVLPGIALFAWLNWEAIPTLAFWPRATATPGATDVSPVPRAGTDPSAMPNQSSAGLFEGLKSPVNAVTFAPLEAANRRSHLTVATADVDGSISIYAIDADTRHIVLRRRLPAHLKPVNSVAFSPDGSRLAAASDDGTISVWDVQQFRQFRRLQGHTGRVGVAAFSADGERILSAGQDGFARLWDIQSETELRQINLDMMRSRPAALAWAPDGNRVVIGAPISGTESASILNIETRREELVLQGVKVPISSVAFSREGDRIFGFDANGRQLVIWDSQTGALLTKFGEQLRRAALTSNGSRALTVNQNGEVEVWDTATGSVVHRFKKTTANTIQMALSADGRHGLTVSTDATMELWDLPPPSPPKHQLRVFEAESPVECVAVSPDGFLGISGDALGVHIWNLEFPAKSYSIEIENRITAVGFFHDTDRFVYATGQSNSTANFAGLRVQRKGGERFHGQNDLRRFEIPAQRYTAAVFFAAGRKLATSNTDGTLRIWDVLTAKTEETVDAGFPINGLALHPDGTRALLAVDDKAIPLWDWKQKQEVGRLQGHTFHVYSVAISGNGKVAASGSGDRTVRVWDLETLEPLAILKGHAARVNSVAISENGDRVLSGSDDGDVRVWDAKTGETKLRLLGHSGSVKGVAFSPDAQHALSGGMDGTVRLWSLLESSPSVPTE